MVYVIEGKPVPLQRARFARDHCWDAQKALKCSIAISLERQHRDFPLLSGPLKLNITFYFAEPVKKRHKLKQPVTECHALRSHITKPDLSNLIKFVEDVATGIIYSDDAIIAEIHAYKCYDNPARTEFELVPLER